jgi:3-oxoacyl-[acyl-carrier-protein] synthase III
MAATDTPGAANVAPSAELPGRRTLHATISGLGAALPEHVITNDDLAVRLNTTDEWIVRRTGIRTRYQLRDGEPIAPLAAQACRRALADAGRDVAEVDRLIVTTITPDRLTPGLAPMVAGLLGCRPQTATLDVNAACTGFLVGLDEAAALVETGRSRVVLVCAAEALSRIVDHHDRSTAILFGDGAGAAVVAAGSLEGGIGSFVHGSDPSGEEALYVDVDEHVLRQSGQIVYRHAVAHMVQVTREALAIAGLTAADVDLFVAHQANARIIEAVAGELGVDLERVIFDMDRCGNTSSATIPLALERAEREGRLKPGATVALTAFGAGFVWSSGVLRWKEGADVRA